MTHLPRRPRLPQPTSIVSTPRMRGCLAGLFCLVIVLAGCTGKGGSPGPGSDDAAQEAAVALATALSNEKVTDLPWSGQPGTEIQRQFGVVISPLGTAKLTVSAGTVSVDGDKASAPMDVSWRFPGVEQAWSYSSTAQLVKENGAWKDVWQRSLMHPDLTDQTRLSMDREQGKRGDILAGDGSALMTERTVVRIGIDKTLVSGSAAEASATSLAGLVNVNAKNYRAAVKAAGDQAFVQAIVFRAGSDDVPSSAELKKIKGAVSIEGKAVLSPSRGFAAPLLGQVGEASKEIIDKSKGTIAAGDQVGLTGLEARYESKLGGTPGVKVSVVSSGGSGSSGSSGSSGASASPSADAPSGSSPSASVSAAPRVVFETSGTDGEDIKLTMDTDLQKIAESVLADTKPDSALVAVKPSTGQILAAASGPGADGANSATFGQYPPGSTFKMASSLALLRAGLKPSSAVNCPATVKVNGQTFKNYDDYPSSSLGRINLLTAVAQSCNTAFISSRDKLGDGDLTAAAASLGIGTDYDVGFPAYYGSVPTAASENELAASLIGQAKVQASPMSMAGAVASIQEGKTVLPYLVDGQKPTSKAKPLTSTEATELRQMLGAVVTQGSGRALQTLEPPTVIAKTGTAEFGTDKPPKTHAWMVAAQGDLAVAVYVGLGDTGSKTAGPLIKEFLQKA